MSKTKVTTEWGVKYRDGRVYIAVDKEDAHRLINESVGTKLVSREKIVTRSRWEEVN